MKIVSLAPSITQTIFFLGLGDELVGVTDQCDDLESLRGKLRIGPFAGPDTNKIAWLNPDLVITAGSIHEPLARELASLGVQVFTFGSTSVEEIFGNIEEVGRLCRRTDFAQSLVGSMRERLAEIERRVPGDAGHPRVFRLMGSEGMMGTPCPGSYQYDAIRLSGGELMPAATEYGYAPVTLEAIAEFDPQIIIGCGRKKGEKARPRCKGCTLNDPACQRVIEDTYTWKGWEGISAIREGRVYSIPCEVICRPGPKVVDLVENMVGILYPPS